VLMIAAMLCSIAGILVRWLLADRSRTSVNESGASDQSQKTDLPAYPPTAVQGIPRE
jgi:hypothetical protein